MHLRVRVPCVSAGVVARRAGLHARCDTAILVRLRTQRLSGGQLRSERFVLDRVRLDHFDEIGQRRMTLPIQSCIEMTMPALHFIIGSMMQCLCVIQLPSENYEYFFSFCCFRNHTMHTSIILGSTAELDLPNQTKFAICEKRQKCSNQAGAGFQARLAAGARSSCACWT